MAIPNFNLSILNDLNSAIDQILKNYIDANIMTAMPAQVKSFDGTFVDVAPISKNTLTNGTVLDITDDDIIPNVPLAQMMGGGGKIIINVSPGDFGLLIACRKDISAWKKNKEILPTPTNRSFSWSDGFFLPLCFSNIGIGINLSQGSTYLNIQDGKVIINTEEVTINASQVNLGGAGGLPVARDTDTVINSVGAVIGTIKATSGTTRSL